MLTKIKKVKNFGIFSNFCWINEIPELKKHNIIYGWNRNVKTTLSRIFSACENKSVSIKEYPKNGEFEAIKSQKKELDEKVLRKIPLQGGL